MTRTEKIREIGKVRAYVRRAEAEVNRIGISPRAAHKYPFDLVGLATLSKVFALSKACLKLLSSDLSDEAFGLSRSIVECATNLRYLTGEPVLQDKRTRDFVKYALADKAFWAHYALEQFAGRKEEQEIREYAKQQGIVPNTKPARQHWSGETGFIWSSMNIDHSLDGPVTSKHKKVSYAADYFQTSAFVHCSLSAIDNYFADDKVPFAVSTSSGLHETTQSTLFVILIYLHSSIGYALHGMNSDRPAKLNSLFQRTLNRLQPVKPRHT
jgi:Family of unknown function (DUF5677)